jgi:hypothetical protein
MFSVGDIIQKKHDLSKRFIILSIRTKDGGNWYHGYYICSIAINQSKESDEITEFMLNFHQYGNEPEIHAILYKNE